MRYSGTWLTPEDETILESLGEVGPAGPDELSRRSGTPNGRSDVADRCATLAGRGGLVSFDRGVFRLTSKGAAYLESDLDPRELGSG